jgi:hypothetical protein
MEVSSWVRGDGVFDAHHDAASDGVRVAVEPNTPFYGSGV